MEETQLKDEIKTCLDMMAALQQKRQALQEELDRLEEQTLVGSYFRQQDHSFYYVTKLDSTQPDYCNVTYNIVTLYDGCASVTINMSSNFRMFRGMDRISREQYYSRVDKALELIQQKIRVD